MKQFVIVTASGLDSLDVHVSFGEYETLEEAYKANGLDADGEPGYGIEYCEYANEHAPGQHECEYCSQKCIKERLSNSTVIVLEVPELGAKFKPSASYTNG